MVGVKLASIKVIELLADVLIYCSVIHIVWVERVWCFKETLAVWLFLPIILRTIFSNSGHCLKFSFSVC